MSPVTWSRLLFVVAMLGLLVSGYLYVSYVTGGPIVCTGSGGCEVVRGSVYARIFTVPTPAYGLVFYFALGSLAALGQRSPARVRILLLLLTGIGVAVSLYLSYLEAFVVEAWCLWCVFSAVLTVIAFLIVWGTLPQDERKQRN